ncbi:interleukin-13 receptor subunit alpha-2-like isoform X2 [Myxocyprinus asiaticus]|uniref:interleukin-13 receptor subunit alpha-2-like isoform X2 n=1 Tax=Myxocyprinus asiaticus TaxID=70543 RepID=UPI002223B3D0|nr:interleukin-13 receptor subunit alpha-2-like isoform X2 [Myxocyprinus asiaticus]
MQVMEKSSRFVNRDDLYKGLYDDLSHSRQKNMLLLNKISAWISAFTLLLLTQNPVCTSAVTACGVFVDPPANIEITDPGLLGHLSIHWTRPDSIQNLTDCTVRYQLRYYDTFEERWRSVRTLKLNFAAQFDLEKPVKVRMLTLLKCPCTNGTEVQGEETERVYTPELTGVEGSRIREFHCVFYGNEYMDCTWESGPAKLLNSQHHLYYWHSEMDETKECPEYIVISGVRRGCRFPRTSLTEFSTFIVCVNGSSPAGNLRTAFFSLEVQNHVKPAAVSSLRLQVSEKKRLVKLDWAPPSGMVPEHCLEYEVESNTTMADGTDHQQRKGLENTSFDFLKEGESKKTCFRVRSKVNMYCADAGFWSNWSQTKCTASQETYIPAWDHLTLVGLLVIAFVLVLVLCLSLWILRKICMKKTSKKGVLYTLYKQKFNKSMPTILSPIFQ